MRHPALTEHVIRIDSLVHILLVDANSDAHEQVLRTLDHLAVDAQQVRAFQSLETEVIVIEITVVHDLSVELLGVRLDDLVHVVREQRRPRSVALVDVLVHELHSFAERLDCGLVQVGNRDSRSEQSVVRVLRRHRSRGFRREFVQLLRRDAREHAHAHLLRDDNLRRENARRRA